MWVAVVPLLGCDRAAVLLPVLYTAPVVHRQCWSVILQRAPSTWLSVVPPLVMQLLQDANGPSEWQMGCSELSHHTHTEPQAAPALGAGEGAGKMISSRVIFLLSELLQYL